MRRMVQRDLSRVNLPNRQNFINGMTGVYHVAAKLSSKGYIVTVTTGNAPTVDMMASTPNLKKTFNIQVKTNGSKSGHTYWLLNKETKQTVSPNLVYVFVNLKENGQPEFYIAHSKIVARNMEKNQRLSGYNFSRNAKYKDNWNTLK